MSKDEKKHTDYSISKIIRGNSDEAPKKLGQYQCIGPCYPPGTTIMHPTTLQLIEGKNFSFCPINPWKDQLNRIHNITLCTKPSTDIVDDKNIEQRLVLSELLFDPAEFLIVNYNIRSLEEAILWYNDHSTVPYDTIKRIMDCALSVYGLNELEPVPDYMIDFVKKIMLTYWSHEYCKSLSTDCISESSLTSLLLTRIITKYVQHYKKDWSNTTSLFSKLKRIAFVFLKKKMSK